MGSIASMAFIHWKTLQGLQQRTAWVQPLYQRQKVLDSLSLSLERYRRLSTSFRKLAPDEVADIKEKLRNAFNTGVAKLDQLDPTPEEKLGEHQLNDQLAELLSVSAKLEPMLFTKDAYLKPEVQDLHETILKSLIHLQKSTDARALSMGQDTSRSESQSMMLLLAVGLVIFILVLSLILRTHFTYVGPLKKLHDYAKSLKGGRSVPENPPDFSGMFGEIQSALNQLALGVETHMRDRHKFIHDFVADLKTPLTLLQSSQHLLGKMTEEAQGGTSEVDYQLQLQAAESVRRGLMIFSGCLDDLNDIVDINRLESKLNESTVDLSELLTDVSRMMMGPEFGRRISVTVPPIPVWTLIDAGRFERALYHVLSKVMETLPPSGGLTISVAQSSQGSFRGVEVMIQDSERAKSGRSPMGGPEQDIVKHWISDNSLSMALVHKIIKAQGGSITAAGVAGTSVSVVIRFPLERVMSGGLISPPAEDGARGFRGLLIKKPLQRQVAQGQDSRV